MRTLGLSVIALAFVLVAGCHEPTVPSPITGKPVTAAQLEAETRAYEAEEEATEKREQAEAEAQLRRLRAKAEADARRLALSQEAQAIDLSQSVDESVQEVIERRTASRAQREAAVAATTFLVNGAMEEIERQRSQRLAGFQVAREVAAASGVPALPAVVSILGGLLVGGADSSFEKL